MDFRVVVEVNEHVRFTGVSRLRGQISDKDVAESVKELVSQIAMPTDSFARMVAFAISQPEEVDVNEISSGNAATTVIGGRSRGLVWI